MTDNKQLAIGMFAIADEYNANVIDSDRDDFDKGEASGTRRTLKKLGFEVKCDSQGIIVSIEEPEWARATAGKTKTLNTMLRETEKRREELGKALEAARQAFEAVRELHERALEDQNDLMAAILAEMKGQEAR